MSKKSVVLDPRERELNEEALDLINQIIEQIQKGLAQEKVKTSVADYLRVVETRLDLLERLGDDEPRVIEVRYVTPDWEKDQPEEPEEPID